MKEFSTHPDPRARIPGVNQLADLVGEALTEIEMPRALRIRLARTVAALMRTQRLGEVDRETIRRWLAPIASPGPRPVINGAGILLHTNLGRSPLPDTLFETALRRVARYTDLELDLESGKRGHRDRHFAELARLVWGVEDATLVNNAAAAVGLSLAAMAGGAQTVVSRGELIEIGGSFRLPDIMSFAGTELVEVGATNKTRPDDYAKAVGPRTACFLKNHTSNYSVEGFTRETSLGELVEIGREKGLPVLMDLGSGLSKYAPFPKMGEPYIEDYLEVDPDLLIFSGDKLFGGVQAGIVLGKKAAIGKLRAHPMMRMVRVDKLTIALVCALLRETAFARPGSLSRLASASPASLRRRAEAIVRLCPGLPLEVIEDDSFIGGGSLPREKRPSISLSLRAPKLNALARQLRRNEPPIISYLREGGLRINLASIFPDQDQAVADALNALPS